MRRNPDPRTTAEDLAALRRAFQTAVGRSELGRYLSVHRRGDDGRWRRAIDLLNPTGLLVTSNAQIELNSTKEGVT